MTEGSSLSEAEFAKWIPAAEAYRWFAKARDSYDGATTAIIKRARDGLIRGAAEVLKSIPERDTYHRIIIPADWWRPNLHDYAGTALWRTEGDTDFEHVTNPNSIYEKRNKYSAYGVRFEPVDILSGMAPINAAEMASPSLKPITHGELAHWFEQLSGTERSFGYRRLWRLARQRLPDRDIKRKQIETFTSGKPRGRRPES